MTLNHTITEEHTITRAGIDDTDPRHSHTIRHHVSGRGCVSIQRGALEISDPYGEAENRQVFTYWPDGDEIAGAIVDMLASYRREVERAAERGDLDDNRSAQNCLELVRRFAGALGLEYVAPGTTARELAEVA